jgi:hypothetical protein
VKETKMRLLCASYIAQPGWVLMESGETQASRRRALIPRIAGINQAVRGKQAVYEQKS